MLNLEAGSAFAHTPIKYLLVSTCAIRTGHSSHGLMEADDVNMRTHNNSQAHDSIPDWATTSSRRHRRMGLTTAVVRVRIQS